MTSLIRYLVVDNPMTFETTRMVRRFLRSNGETNSRGLNTVILSLLGVLYLWVYVAIFKYREDMSAGLLGLELITLTLGIPASMYQAVSGERERLTWDSLIMTPLSPSRILVGKLLWRLLLIAAVMLLFTGPLLLGHSLAKYKTDYTLGTLMQVQAIVGSWAVFLACFSLWVSAKTKRTVTTLSVLTAALFAFLVLVPVLFNMFGGHAGLTDSSYYRSNPGSMPYYPSTLEIAGALLLHFNPFFAVFNGFESSAHSDRLREMGIYVVLPFLYLMLSALCLAGTKKILSRLGLPGQKER